MPIIEEKGRVVSVQGEFAEISPINASSCNSCESKAGCGTALLKPLFNSKKVHLQARNLAGAEAGDSVVIGLESMAVVLSSLLIYLLPLLMLITGGSLGEYLAHRTGVENVEIVSILTGLLSAIVAFLVSRIYLRSSYFRVLCQPVVLRVD